MNKIFIVGCPRSGTTIIQKILGARDDVYTCKETHYFQKIRRKGKGKLIDYLILSNGNVISAYNFIEVHNCLLEDYDHRRIYTIKAATLFFDHLMTSEARVREKTTWVEKTPAHLFFVKLIQKQIKSAQFIHVLRDGRDVIASLVDAAKRNPKSPAWKGNLDLNVAIGTYNKYLNESIKYFGSEGHIFFKYESLIDNSEQSIENLYQMIGFEEGYYPLDYDAVHKKVVRNDEVWKRAPSGRIKDTRLIKFNKIFNESDKQLIIDGITKPSINIMNNS